MRAPAVWADMIGEVSDTFKNATISLLNPSLVTSTFSVDTNAYVQAGDPVVASGIAARVQPVRLAVDTRASSTGNPSSEVRMRVQIPRTAYSGKIQRGWQILVTTADRNPELENYLLVVDAVVDSSWRASITIEATVNVENDYTPTTPTAISGSVEYDGEPRANVTVRAFYEENDVWLWAIAANTDADGTYRLSGTDPTKTYAVVASGLGLEPNYYDGATGFGDADAVAHNATGVDFVMVDV